MIRRPPRSTLFPYTRSSDLQLASCGFSPTISCSIRARRRNACRKSPSVLCIQVKRPSLPVCRCKVGLSWERVRSEEHTSELQSHLNLVCRLLLEKKKQDTNH